MLPAVPLHFMARVHTYVWHRKTQRGGRM